MLVILISKASHAASNTASTKNNAKESKDLRIKTTVLQAEENKQHLQTRANPALVLQHAKNEYAFGSYAKAEDLLRSILYPVLLESQNALVEARELLALSLHLQDRLKEAKVEFIKLLYASPSHELDPFSISPPIVALFEQLKLEHADALKELTRDKEKNEASLEVPLGTQYWVERSEIGTFLPFGIGQFQNGDTAWGTLFAILQTGLLATNVGSYLWVRQQRVRGRLGYGPDKATAVRNATVLQYVSAALFGVTWSASVIHARRRFEPYQFKQDLLGLSKKATVDVSPVPWDEYSVSLSFNY